MEWNGLEFAVYSIIIYETIIESIREQQLRFLEKAFTFSNITYGNMREQRNVHIF